MASTQQAQLPQTAQVREMEEYINNSDFQQVTLGPLLTSTQDYLLTIVTTLAAVQLMHSLMTEVFTKKPENTIDFMLQWLEQEKERRVQEKLSAMQQ